MQVVCQEDQYTGNVLGDVIKGVLYATEVRSIVVAYLHPCFKLVWLQCVLVFRLAPPFLSYDCEFSDHSSAFLGRPLPPLFSSSIPHVVSKAWEPSSSNTTPCFHSSLSLSHRYSALSAHEYSFSGGLRGTT